MSTCSAGSRSLSCVRARRDARKENRAAGSLFFFSHATAAALLHARTCLCPRTADTTTQHAAKLLVGNKIDLQQREVSVEEAQKFARKQAMMYIEASAKTRAGIQQSFEEVVQKILDTPQIMAEMGGSPLAGLQPRLDDEPQGRCSTC